MLQEPHTAVLLLQVCIVSNLVLDTTQQTKGVLLPTRYMQARMLLLLRRSWVSSC
jgi:hypothetical protein